MHEYYLRTFTTRAACVATIVDPRYKDRIFTWFEESVGDGMRMHNKAVTRFKETYNRYQTRASEIDTYERLHRDEKQSKEGDGHRMTGGTPFLNSKMREQILSNQSSTDRYLDEPLLPRDSKTSHLEVWKYWESKQFEFPIIVQIARDFLPIPASSAASERVFSQGGDLITKKRNRISGANTRYVLCLRSLGVFVGDDDFDETEEQKQDRDAKEELGWASRGRRNRRNRC
jgi:hypothetical protein